MNAISSFAETGEKTIPYSQALGPCTGSSCSRCVGLLFC